MRQVGFLLYYSIESSTLMGNSAFFANGFISQIVLLYVLYFIFLSSDGSAVDILLWGVVVAF